MYIAGDKLQEIVNRVYQNVLYVQNALNFFGVVLNALFFVLMKILWPTLR